MAFTAKDVQTLRERTGVGMMDCKKALTETDGDMEKAIDILREKGLAAAAKKASRIAAEGLVYAAVDDAKKVGVVVEVNSETDFVAKNADFQAFVKAVADVIADKNPADVAALLALPFEGGLTVADALRDKILVIGENPEMAGTMGVNVYKMQYLCVMASGMLAAIGGAYLSIGDINMFSKDMVSGRGYIALSMVILGNWKPLWVALGGLVYGFAQSLQFRLQGVNIPPQLVQMLPYILTLVVLLFARKKSSAPAASGKHYYQKGE